jgi:UDP-glucose 4-epimerase
MAKLLEYIIRGQRQCHIVFFSSAAVYGNPQSLPVNEAAPPQPISPYGIHKLVAEDMLRHYSAVFGITGSIIRIFSAYGNGQKKQLLWDALSKYRESIKNNMKNVTFSGTGKESRDFIHARDIAAASLLVGSAPVLGKIQIINVANGEDVAIDNILSSLFKLLPVPLFIHFDGHASAGYPIHWKADISRLKQIGYVSSIDIKKGLAEYVEWFNSQLQDV